MEQEFDLKAVQDELLSMMKELHKLFMDHGVKYSLTGGSLLGAVREKGFIPWDDDIDIMVDRENYAKLCEALQSSKDYELGRGPWLQHIKPRISSSEIEPYVDVFIMDHLPDSGLRAKIKIFSLRMLQGMLKEQVEYKGFSFIYKVCIFATHVLGLFFTRRFKLKTYDRVSQMGNSEATGYISITNDSFGLLTKKHVADVMKDYTEWDFEDTKFMITKRYDSYLTVRYGSDYMTPPPVEERIYGQHANRPKVSNERTGV